MQENAMKKIMIRKRNDYCTSCNTERIVDCYDRYNKPINYTLFLDMYEKDNSIVNKLDSKQISYFKCKKCGMYYVVDWTDTKLPKPIYADNININAFLRKNYNID